jgi:hypothetical protein
VLSLELTVRHSSWFSLIFFWCFSILALGDFRNRLSSAYCSGFDVALTYYFGISAPRSCQNGSICTISALNADDFTSNPWSFIHDYSSTRMLSLPLHSLFASGHSSFPWFYQYSASESNENPGGTLGINTTK